MPPQPPPLDLADALRHGPFEAALDCAVRASGLSLERIQHRLAARGVAVSVTTLSYWRRGRSRPERPQSRQAVRLLEELLALPTDSLVSLLGPQRPRGRWVNRPPLTLETGDLWQQYKSLPGLLDAMGSTDDGLTRLAVHDRYEIDENGAERRLTVTMVLRAEHERVDRLVLISRGDDPQRALPEIIGIRNARKGRVRSDTSVPLSVAELLLDRVLTKGETDVIEYTYAFSTSGARTSEVGTGFRAPARLYTVEVQFHPDAVPVRCHRYSGTTAGGPMAPAEQVWISASGRAAFTVEDPGPGFQAMRWEWE